MRYVRFIWVMVNVFLVTNLFAAATKPVIVIKTDKNQTVIGGLVTLVMEVRGTGIKHVAWGPCDMALANVEKITILKTTSSAGGDSVFKHTIIFTSTKPGSIRIARLPVTLNDATGDHQMFTDKLTLNFKNEALLTNINDINANVATRFSELKYVLFGALLVIIVIIVFAARYSVDKKKIESIGPAQIRQETFEKLKVLEQQTENDQVADKAFEILKDFLQQAFTTIQFTGTESDLLQSINSLPVEKGDKELIIGILKASANARFAKPLNNALTAAYIAKVKDFISGISLAAPIKV